MTCRVEHIANVTEHLVYLDLHAENVYGHHELAAATTP